MATEPTVYELRGDDDAVNLTLLVPPVRLDGRRSVALETVAVVTPLAASGSGAADGQDYRYELVPLTGEAILAEL